MSLSILLEPKMFSIEIYRFLTPPGHHFRQYGTLFGNNIFLKIGFLFFLPEAIMNKDKAAATKQLVTVKYSRLKARHDAKRAAKLIETHLVFKRPPIPFSLYHLMVS
jgi:hypothetical protein